MTENISPYALNDDAADDYFSQIYEPYPCDDYEQILQEFMESEQLEHDELRLRTHATECRPCMERLSVEQIVRSLIVRSCTEKAPEGLRDKVVKRCYEIDIDIEF